MNTDDGTIRLRRKHKLCKHLWNMPASTGTEPSACVLMTQKKSMFWAISTRILSGKSGLEPHLADFVNFARIGRELISVFLSPKNRE
jgi:hypothetical protein